VIAAVPALRIAATRKAAEVQLTNTWSGLGLWPSAEGQAGGQRDEAGFAVSVNTGVAVPTRGDRPPRRHRLGPGTRSTDQGQGDDSRG
jgi:hypothetical protein